MFENLYVGQNESKKSTNKEYRLGLLLQKYVELKKIEQLDLNSQQKKVLKKNKRSKRLLSKLIRDRLTKRLKPEETFEIWDSQNNLNVNLEKQIPFKAVDDIIDELGAPRAGPPKTEGALESDEDDDGDDDASESEKNSEAQVNKFLSTFDGSDSWTKANLLIRTRGLETLPQSSGTAFTKGTVGFNKYHITNLRNLLHLNILRGNWDLAYKVFCLLVRLPHVDIRSIWPLGIEILQQQRKAIQSQSESEHDQHQLLLLKDERFFDWLSSFHILARTTVSNTRSVAAPIWRSGSRTHAPLYLITSLWNLLVKGEVLKVSERLEELLLEPPFNTDGSFYFLLALCQMINCMNGDDIVSNKAKIEKNLNKCKQCNFEYPRDLIEKELKQVFNQSDLDIKLKGDDSSDEEEESDIAVGQSIHHEEHSHLIPMAPFDDFNESRLDQFDEDIPDGLNSLPIKATEEADMDFEFELD